MKSIERFADLMRRSTVEDWRNQVFKLGSDLGYERVMLAISSDPHAPAEAGFFFVQSNYSPDWRNKYDAEKMGHVDPTVTHCISKATPLIWSPGIFSARKQQEMYEEACGYGLRSGVTLPIHGARGELGALCFVTDVKPDQRFRRDTNLNIPELSCLRDFIFETSLQFMQPSCPAEEPASITHRELECLKWSAAGKSSWEIGQILNCTEATVNFHFNNLRRKFNTTSRQHVVIKAINLGLIHPM
jgi:LuxR family quorum-sensing transcriptional regulator LasR